MGLVLETHCNYFALVAFPDAVVVGIRVTQRGSSSVRYEIGFLPAKHCQPFLPFQPSVAKGHYSHVYVDRQTPRPAPLPPE